MSGARTPLLLLLCLLCACGEGQGDRAARREREQSLAKYQKPHTRACNAVQRNGAMGYTDNLRTVKGVAITVVTPRNYQQELAHPLLVVYAPAGIDRFEVERVTAFTEPATRAGFVVAYADHRPLGPQSTKDLGSIPAIVAARWCIDAQRVFYSGHSDGGSVANALAAMPETRNRALGIAPSAAGITHEDLAAYGCPRPLAVMLSHSKRDKLFPNWGAGVAQWWAACNRCDVKRARAVADECVAYEGCDPRAPTLYCEGDGTHAKWPGRATAIVQFFQTVLARETP